jgi:hypothetical protein
MDCLARLMRWAMVGHPPLGDPDQPASRVVRYTLFRPLDGSGEQRLLHRVLGGVEVSEPPDERAEDLGRQVTQQVRDAGARRHRSHISAPPSQSMIGCTSTVPAVASATRAASSTARSWVSTS